MTQKGSHTWDIIIQYHRCPNCGFIIESRDDWQYHLGKYQKDLECPRCKYAFTETKRAQPHFGPLIGTPQKAEFDWSE